MIIIEDILISDEVIEEQFVCNLNACKGACCWEGDFGAPLEAEEIRILENNYDQIKEYLPEEGQKVIEASGVYHYYKEENNSRYAALGQCRLCIHDP